MRPLQGAGYDVMSGSVYATEIAIHEFSTGFRHATDNRNGKAPVITYNIDNTVKGFAECGTLGGVNLFIIAKERENCHNLAALIYIFVLDEINNTL